MDDAHKSLRRTAYTIAGLGISMTVLVVVFKFGIRDDAYPFQEAWARGLVQGFLILNAVLVVIALGLLKLQSWARWAAFLWGAGVGASGLTTELLHYRSISAVSIYEAIVITLLWGWFMYKALFNPDVAALFSRRVDV